MEGGKTANYWPGFVDALTNVVIAMVFVIVVLAIALSFAAQLMGKKIAEQVIAQHDKAASAAASAAVSAAVALARAQPQSDGPRDEGAAHSALGVARIAVHGNERATHAEGGTLSSSPNSLQLDFDSAALALDADAAANFKAALAATKADPAASRLEVVGSGPSMELSENQRSAYVRVMGVRNQLIDQGWPPSHISVRINTASRAATAAVTVSLLSPSP